MTFQKQLIRRLCSSKVLSTHQLRRNANPSSTSFRLYPQHSRYTTTKLFRMPHIQDQVQLHSLNDPESFWAHQVEQLYWHRRPSSTLKKTIKKLPSGTSHPHWTWFPDGEISTSYNCIDRHVENGYGDSTAVIWDSPVTGSKEYYSYKQLLKEVETLAGVLREEGVRKGDVVLVYSKP